MWVVFSPLTRGGQARTRGLISDIRMHTINFSAKMQWPMNNNVTV
jgi:hypothetical protein